MTKENYDYSHLVDGARNDAFTEQQENIFENRCPLPDRTDEYRICLGRSVGEFFTSLTPEQSSNWSEIIKTAKLTMLAKLGSSVHHHISILSKNEALAAGWALDDQDIDIPRAIQSALFDRGFLSVTDLSETVMFLGFYASDWSETHHFNEVVLINLMQDAQERNQLDVHVLTVDHGCFEFADMLKDDLLLRVAKESHIPWKFKSPAADQ